ncbi:uncharacterized protein BJ171DRAFT_565552, partial [Polychytrium aggregatum]|uniref:uncharacterized protein n=1 Tax=Polychytrium aggregatum TaxID=110093 RepID=UPI0022FDBCD5
MVASVAMAGAFRNAISHLSSQPSTAIYSNANAQPVLGTGVMIARMGWSMIFVHTIALGSMYEGFRAWSRMARERGT